MLNKVLFIIFSAGILVMGCDEQQTKLNRTAEMKNDSAVMQTSEITNTTTDDKREISIDSIPNQQVNTNNVSPAELLTFARTLIGVPYKFASTDPAQGFDCSGFITYVFNHFDIKVPRSSIDFTNVGLEVPADKALPGDLILFTGTDSTKRFVGHMGIINERNADSATFIHSTSGKAFGVTITPFNSYYKSRFVKVIRIFQDNDQLSL